MVTVVWFYRYCDARQRAVEAMLLLRLCPLKVLVFHAIDDDVLGRLRLQGLCS